MTAITSLRELCLAVETEQKTLVDLAATIEKHEKHVENLKAQREHQSGKVAYAIGGRDAVAKVALPGEMTLTEAWEANYQGLRDPELVKKPYPKGPKAVDSGKTGNGKKA